MSEVVDLGIPARLKGNGRELIAIGVLLLCGPFLLQFTFNTQTFWYYPDNLLWLLSTFLVFVASLHATSRDRPILIPVYSVLPYSSFIITAKGIRLLERGDPSTLYANVEIILLLSASWGLTGGLFGYFIATWQRILRENENIPRKELATHIILLSVAAALSTTAWVYLWIHRGVGDAL